MNNHSTQNIHHADAPASADAPGCASPPPSDAVQSAVFAALNAIEENALLRVDATGDASPIYGGIARREVVTLVRVYQAGSIDPVAFALALLLWRHQQPSDDLLKAAAAYFREMYGRKSRRMLTEFARASLLLMGHPPGPISRDLIGHANWWRVQILMYMLQNPKPVYQIREFVQRLKADNLNTDTKDIRAFCKKHNIARDSRPGRPSRKGTQI